jgi:hypothetical protein
MSVLHFRWESLPQDTRLQPDLTTGVFKLPKTRKLFSLSLLDGYGLLETGRLPCLLILDLPRLSLVPFPCTIQTMRRQLGNFS